MHKDFFCCWITAGSTRTRDSAIAATNSEWIAINQAAFSGGETCFFCIASQVPRWLFLFFCGRQAAIVVAAERHIAKGEGGGNAILIVLGKFETNSLLSRFRVQISEDAMTGADVGRYVLLIALGIFAFLAFLYAGTIVGLMWLESSYCNCLYFPVGLYVLALLAILIIATLISEAIDMPVIVQEWIDTQKPAQLQEAFIIGLIFLVVLILILS